jgi:hypothetical protein
MTHLIRQQYLHIEYNGSESEGLALQNRLGSICYDCLLPAIERTLDRFSPAEGRLCIERLEIDAGCVDMETLERDLAESVARALEKSLKEELPPAHSSPRHKTPQQTLEQAFIYFLNTGALPWSFRLPANTDLESVLLYSWRQTGESSGQSHAGHNAVLRALASSTARSRLIRQFSASFRETLLAMFSQQALATVSKTLEGVRSFALSSAIRDQLAIGIWEAAFACVAAREMISETDLVNKAWSALSVPGLRSRESINRFGNQIQEAVVDTPIPKDPAFNDEPETSPSGVITKKDVAAVRSASDGGDRLQVSEGIYLENAGLVLLHPFLPQLFDSLGIAAGEKLLKPERALCLLHYLGSGQLKAPEYLMVLPKVLCGVDLSTAIESDVNLTATEQEEAEGLLKAVIGHWEALRNTSADGLRGTFLLRPGKLSLRGEEWLLQVESQTCDILMQQLPWGISMVKLPWMERMLWVEWS